MRVEGMLLRARVRDTSIELCARPHQRSRRQSEQRKELPGGGGGRGMSRGLHPL